MGRGREEKEPEEKKSEKRKKGRRQEIKVRKKVQKSQSTVFLQCFVAQEGRKVGMKWCREAHFEVKIVKIPHVRSSFAS
jgi:hypothetical protein